MSLFGASLLLLTAVFAEMVSLDEAAPLPLGTKLLPAEERFAKRGKTGGFAMKPSKYGCYLDERVKQDPASPGAVRYRYRRAKDPFFCGAYLIVLGDLSRFAALSFWVKGARGGETFEIGMNDTISNKREDAVFIGSIHRYLPGGITTDWQEVRVPLEDFFGVDLSRVYSLVFNFNEEGEGAFWIDGLRFDTEPLVSVQEPAQRQGFLLLDDFDHSDINLLGRKTGTYKRPPSVCLAKRVLESRRGEQGRSLRLDFDKQATGWCGYYTLLNQIDGAYYDLSPFKALSFWARGEKGGETFEIGLSDKSWLTIGDSVKAGTIEKFLPGGLTAGWQEVVIPLAQFGKLDWTQMGSFVVNFHRPGKGRVYLDDLIFIRKTQEELLEEWE
ncbi:MAG: hypothetical protein HYS41_04515 [Candidatus Omnitrophica bacterium]|nr:hypothetical protein [Candidatus Omnitrophota bacterium]